MSMYQGLLPECHSVHSSVTYMRLENSRDYEDVLDANDILFDVYNRTRAPNGGQ